MVEAAGTVRLAWLDKKSLFHHVPFRLGYVAQRIGPMQIAIASLNETEMV